MALSKTVAIRIWAQPNTIASLRNDCRLTFGGDLDVESLDLYIHRYIPVWLGARTYGMVCSTWLEVAAVVFPFLPGTASTDS